MSSKINLQTCEYACKSSIFQDNQLISILNQNGSIQHSALEYKEDGDILIDAKTNKVEFKTKNSDAKVWDKYSVEKGSLIINVEDIDEKDVMPISTDAIASGSVASGNKPQ